MESVHADTLLTVLIIYSVQCYLHNHKVNSAFFITRIIIFDVFYMFVNINSVIINKVNSCVNPSNIN